MGVMVPSAAGLFFVNNFRSALFMWTKLGWWLQTDHTKPLQALFVVRFRVATHPGVRGLCQWAGELTGRMAGIPLFAQGGHVKSTPKKPRGLRKPRRKTPFTPLKKGFCAKKWFWS